MQGDIPISKDSQLIVESETSFDLTTVELLLSNQGDRDVLLTIEYSENGDGEKQKQIIVPAGETDWVSIPSEENIWLGEVELKVEKNGQNSPWKVYIFRLTSTSIGLGTKGLLYY